MAGTLTPGLLDEKVDENGTCFKDAAASAGYGGKSHQVRTIPSQSFDTCDASSLPRSLTHGGAHITGI